MVNVLKNVLKVKIQGYDLENGLEWSFQGQVAPNPHTILLTSLRGVFVYHKELNQTATAGTQLYLQFWNDNSLDINATTMFLSV